MVDGDPVQSSSPSSLSISQQQQQEQQPSGKHQISFSPPFDNTNHLPDLMPMMFPSDDPFAYPNQPMSTLEDDHFKHDPTSNAVQFAFGSTPPVLTATGSSPNPSTSSTPTYDGFSGAPIYSNQRSTYAASLPSHHKHLPQYTSHQQIPSMPPPGYETSAGIVTTPDPTTMSIPDQNFLWQGLGAQQVPEPQSQGQQQLASVQVSPGVPGFGMGMRMGIGMTGFGGLGMNMGMNLDDLLSGGDGPVEWNQWMDIGA
jgi:hypothetical protein